MTWFDYKAVAEALQARLEERCAVDGYRWEQVDPEIVACYWCHAIDTPVADEAAKA